MQNFAIGISRSAYEPFYRFDWEYGEVNVPLWTLGTIEKIAYLRLQTLRFAVLPFQTSAS